MISTCDEICREVGKLRKGSGVWSSTRGTRVGPSLRQLAGGFPGATTVDWSRLLARLETCAARLADEPKMAALVGLNMWPPAAKEPSQFEDRLHWLGQKMNCSARTARRRVNEAHEQLAAEIERELTGAARSAAGPPSGWILRELSTRLRLDVPQPVAYEDRRIVATAEGLSEIKAWWDFPAGPAGSPQIIADVSYGGRLVRREEGTAGDHQAVFIELPRPLRSGEEYQFGIELRVADGATMHPHYVFTPELPCELFKLRIRFGGPPRWIREVRGQTVRAFSTARTEGAEMAVNAANEVDLAFSLPQCYLGYGAQWEL